ncbi:MAG: autoinducer binding domain-containing protein [Geobacter sp.]|nr:autoinducer binding domain-containing protein [Geobacter sp.]
MSDDTFVSHCDALKIAELIEQAAAVRSKEEMLDLMLGMRGLITFEYGTSVFASVDGEGKLKRAEAINLTYPMEWLHIYVSRSFHEVDPIFKENFASYGLQYWDDTFRRCPAPRDFLSLATDFRLERGYSLGLRDGLGNGGSLISFAGNVEHHPRTERILQRLLPHLHQALTMAATGTPPEQPDSIVPGSLELLRRLKDGDSFWDISMALGISEGAVISLTDEIAARLGVASSRQAVAKALASGLITL